MNIETTLAERGSRYGDFADHANITQAIKQAMLTPGSLWADLPNVHKQALEVIADKIARILSGDPWYADNPHDIAGYARLMENFIVSGGKSCLPQQAEAPDALPPTLAAAPPPPPPPPPVPALTEREVLDILFGEDYELPRSSLVTFDPAEKQWTFVINEETYKVRQ